MAAGDGRAFADVMVLPAPPDQIQVVRSEAGHAGLTLRHVDALCFLALPRLDHLTKRTTDTNSTYI